MKIIENMDDAIGLKVENIFNCNEYMVIKFKSVREPCFLFIDENQNPVEKDEINMASFDITQLVDEGFMTPEQKEAYLDLEENLVDIYVFFEHFDNIDETIRNLRIMREFYENL